MIRSAGVQNANNFERWERSYSYDALYGASGGSTKIKVANQPQSTPNQQSYFDRNDGRAKQMRYPQSAIDQPPVSTYLAYNGVSAPVKEGFAADYVVTNPTSSPAIHQITIDRWPGLVNPESYGVTASNRADWRTNSVFDSSGWLSQPSA